MTSPPPTHTALVRRARRIERELAVLYPDVHTELNFTTPLELLVATILSAQTTDKRVNLVTPILFARYPTAADYAAADRVMAGRTRGRLAAPRLMSSVYGAILKRMEHEGWAPPRQRVKLGKGQMFAIVARRLVLGR